MNNLRKAAEMALDALHNIDQSNNYDAIEALRQALSNEFNPDWDQIEALQESLREHMAEIQRLRQALNVDAVNISAERVDETAKCKREWVEITKGECDELFRSASDHIEYAYAIEAKLKEKNT